MALDGDLQSVICCVICYVLIRQNIKNIVIKAMIFIMKLSKYY